MKMAISTLALLLAATFPGDPPPRLPDEPTGKAASAGVEAGVGATVDAFVSAFNKGACARLAKTFTDDAEMTDVAGETVRGRAAIQAHFARWLTDAPGSTIAVKTDAIRLLAAAVAIEEGHATVTPPGGGTAEVTRYEVIHARVDGSWLQARVREFEHANLTPRERLKPLEWLVGEWVDEADEGVVQTSCSWSDDRNFLVREFRVHAQGRPARTGSQRIGWDPATRQIKSWTFDATGATSEQFWAEDDDGRWIIKSIHVLPDGRRATATQSSSNAKARTRPGWVSADKTVGDQAAGRRQRVPPGPPPAPAEIGGGNSWEVHRVVGTGIAASHSPLVSACTLPFRASRSR